MSNIRIRNKLKGTTAELRDECMLVEITDLNGDIAVLIYPDEAGAVKTVMANDPMAARYEKIYGVKFVPVLPVKGAK
jgi:hypothetical protein